MNKSWQWFANRQLTFCQVATLGQSDSLPERIGRDVFTRFPVPTEHPMKKLNKKQTDTASRLCESLAEAVVVLRERGTVNTPPAAVMHSAIAGCINSRTGKWRKTEPSDEPSALLWQLVKFHRSNGNLWGYPHFADPALRDQLDTVALLLLGNRSSAYDAYKRCIK